MLKASQISQLINEVYDGVERSKCGKIMMDKFDDKGNQFHNTIALQTYLKLLDSLLPKNIGMNIKEDSNVE